MSRERGESIFSTRPIAPEQFPLEQERVRGSKKGGKKGHQVGGGGKPEDIREMEDEQRKIEARVESGVETERAQQPVIEDLPKDNRRPMAINVRAVEGGSQRLRRPEAFNVRAVEGTPRNEEEKKIEEDFKQAKSRLWRLNVEEATIRNIKSLEEAQAKIAELESSWRNAGPNQHWTKEQIDQILADEYPIEKILEMRKELGPVPAAVERKSEPVSEPVKESPIRIIGTGKLGKLSIEELLAEARRISARVSSGDRKEDLIESIVAKRQEIGKVLPKQLKVWGLSHDQIKEIMSSSDPYAEALKVVDVLRKPADVKEPEPKIEKAVEPKVSVATREVDEDVQLTRDLAEFTFARLPGYKDKHPLHAKTEEEGNKIFLEKTRELWKEFALSGRLVYVDKQSKTINLPVSTDLDGRSAMGLLQLAGIDTRNVRIVPPGNLIEGKFNVDTGYQHGIVVKDQGRTAFADHHTPESGHESSATKFMYEGLTKLGLLERADYLDKVVDFVNHNDNKTYPDDVKYFKDSARTVLGLQRFMRFYQLAEYFKSGRKATEILSDDELKQFNISEPDDKLDLLARSKEQQKAVDQAELLLPQMEKEGLIIDSEKYGKIVVDVNKRLQAGADAAKWYGAGAYINWNNGGFFISTLGIPLQEKFGDGVQIRDTMWVKNSTEKEKVNITLADVLNAMTDGKLESTGALKNYLETGRLSEPEKLIESKSVTEKEAQDILPAKEKVEPSIEQAKEKKEGERKKLYAAELSDYVDAYARQKAREEWQELFKNSGFIRRMVLHTGENYFVDVKLYNQIRDSIEKNNTLMTLLKTRVLGKDVQVSRGEKESGKLTDAIIEAYEKDLGLKDNEKAEKVEDKEFDQKLGNLMYLHAKNNWDRKEFDSEVNKLLKTVYKSKHKDSSEHVGNVFASNIYQYAEEYKGQIKDAIEKFGPENVEAVTAHVNGLMKIDLYMGKIDSDIRKHPKKLAFFESLPAWVQRNKIVNTIANPFVFGSASSIVGRMATRKTLSKGLTTATAAFMLPTTAGLWVPLAAGAVAGAAYTSLRRKKELTEDWTSERQQMAAGKIPGGENAEKIREYLMQMVDASERASELKNIKEADDSSIKLVAGTIAKLELEQEDGVQEMFRASAENADINSRRADLNKLYEALKEVEARPGLSREDLRSNIDAEKSTLKDAMSEMETAFKWHKLKQSGRAAISGALTSIAGGIISQEAIYWGKEALGYSGGDTVLHAGTRKLITGEWTKHYLGDLSEVKQIHTAGIDSSIHSPKGFDFIDHGNGTGDYVYNGEHIADNLVYDEHGLTAEAQKTLTDKGFIVRVERGDIQIVPDTAKSIVKEQMKEATIENLKQKYSEADWGTHHRVDWHHEGPQESSWFGKVIEHPGKEQMLYLSKDDAGRVIVDGHKILENLAANLNDGNESTFTNPDGSLDHKMGDLFAKLADWNEKDELGKHLQAVIIPDKGSPISASFVADGTGRVSLPESLSKLVTDLHDGKLPFMIELRLDDGHVLATASGGNGMFNEVVSDISRVVPNSIEQFHTYIRPPLVDDIGPMLSTPMAKRYNLETFTVKGKEEVSPKIKPETKPIKPKIIEKVSEPKVEQEAREVIPTPEGVMSVADTDTGEAPREVEKQVEEIGEKIPEPRRILGDISPTRREQLDLPEKMRIKADSELRPGLFDIYKAREFLEGIENSKAGKARAEEKITETFKELEGMVKNKKQQKEIFGELMVLLGFERKDWTISGDKISIKRMVNAALTKNWHLDHPKQFEEFLEEIAQSQPSSEFEKFKKNETKRRKEALVASLKE